MGFRIKDGVKMEDGGMTISEAIRKLEGFKEKYGDVEVYARDGRGDLDAPLMWPSSIFELYGQPVDGPPDTEVFIVIG